MKRLSGALDTSPAQVLLLPVWNSNWDSAIQTTVFEVAITFGFQLYNKHPKPETLEPGESVFVPATYAVASEHLLRQVRDNFFRTSKNLASSPSGPEKVFEDLKNAIADLHDEMFSPFQRWEKHVQLPSAGEQNLQAHLWIGQLAELSLMFLLYTEASSLRHTPELMWLIYWIMQHSMRYTEVLSHLLESNGRVSRRPMMWINMAMPVDDRDWWRELGGSLTAVRKELRNMAYITEPLRTMGQIILHQGRDLRSYRVLNEEGQYRALIQAVKGEVRQAKAKVAQSGVMGVLSKLEKLESWISDDDDGLLLSLLAEVAILDDGSLFLDRVVQPFFTYLVQQVFEMGHEGIESAKRVAYDDVNESCTVPEAVHIALTQIEVLEPGRGKKKLNQKKCAFDCLLNTGTKENLADKERSPAQLEEDAGHKAEFWGTNLFQKTFMERRTPFMAYRAFLRVYVFLAVYFHLLLAIAFSEKSDGNEFMMGVTTISITHCSMMLFSEAVGLYVIQPLSTKLPAVAKGMTAGTASVRIHQYWGEMTRRGLSFIVWLLILLVLVAALVNNNVEYVPSLKQGWWYVGWGYIYVVLVFETLRHSVAGYSLSSLGEILLGRSSADKYMAPRSNLATSQAHYLPNNFMWLCVFAIKIPLDYFAIIRPLEPFYDRIIRQQWYVYTYSACTNRTDKGCSGFSLDWLLAMIMMAPALLTVLYDTGIIYQVVSAAFGTAYGLLWQHLGAVRRWDGVVASFLKAPRKWSKKCVSREGLTSIMHQLGSEDTFVQVEKQEGSRQGNPAVRTFGDQRGRRSLRSSTFNISTMARDVPQSTITEAITELMKKKKYTPKELQYVATQIAFLEPWNELVQDMRSRDLLNDAEQSALLYERLSENVLDINEKDKASASPAKPSASTAAAQPPKRQQSRRRGDGLGTVSEEEIQPLAASSQVSSQVSSAIPSQKTSRNQPTSTPGAASVMFAFSRILGNKNNNRPPKPEPVPDEVDIGSGVSVELFPYLLPKMIAAGQVYEVLRTFAPSQNQMLIMWESYQWLLWLLARTGLINEGQLRDLRDEDLRLPSRVKTTQQEKDRQTMLGDVVSLLECLPTEKQFDDYAKLIASKKESGGTAVQALLESAGFKTHAKAIRDKAQKLLDGSVKELASHKKSVDRHGKARGNALTTLKDLERVLGDEEEMIQRIAASITFIVQLKGKGPATYCKVIKWLVDTLTKGEGDAVPENKEAQRILYFFLTSLHNPLMPKARPLHETKSLTTLTPHYAETVMHGLDAHDAERMLQPLGFPKSKQDDDKTFLFDRDGKPTGTLRYLHTVYAEDWKNFCERMKRLAQEQGLKSPQFVSELDFKHGNDLYPLRHQLLMWACLRGQPLARTVRGMMAYRQALVCMAKVEYAKPEGVSKEEFYAQIDELVDSKFNYCVTSQILGSLIAEKKDLTKRWTARGLEALMMMFPKLQVSYVDTQKDSHGRNIQWSVLLQPGEPLNPNAPNFALENVPKKPTEVYRVRLPINYKSPRGVVLGEGKPENQNHAIIFCFGECIQTIDMNQDNVFAEALKMRNLLAEFVDDRVPGHVALVGFREWIISQDCGALADFAASTELTFGSLVQRVMTVPSAVRFHYGHPDVWNKRFIMYRGGVSKANKSLHVSEDVFGGYNCTLRGGLIKFSEYISVGKGRDMGFDSINGFEAKISAGNGEQVLSRDVYRLGSMMDFFRLMSWYHTGNGFFINTALTMFSVKVAAYSAAVMALTGIIGSEGVTLRLAGLQIVQLGSFSILVYAFTVGLDKGIASTVGDILGQMVSGSLFFFIFRAQTSAANFVNTLRYGGAAYVATGRGFLLTTLPFEQIWRLFGRTHMYFGMELALLLILANVVRAASFVYLLPSWVVVLALLLGPFWFNPFAFETKKVKAEFQRWMSWMNKNGSLKDDNCWRVWHKKDMGRARNDNTQQTDRIWLCLWMLAGTAPTVILALSAVNDARSSNEGKKGFHPTRWQLFAVVSIPVYTMAAILLTMDYYYIKTGMRTWLRYLRFFIAAFAAVLFSLGLIYLIGDKQRVKNLYILLYAMLQLLQALKIILLFGFSGSALCRMFVDRLFFATDITIGVVLFAIRYLLSLLGIVNRIQGTLLFNTAYARQYVFEQDMKGTELEAIVVEARRRAKQQ